MTTRVGKEEVGDRAERRRILLTEYREVCQSHAGITVFRGKLLALLPIASATGIGLLVFKLKGEVAKVDAWLLLALGAFGMLVTVGLFLYELRQIDVCKQLRNHAAWLEQQLGIAAGQFGGRRNHLSIADVYSPHRHREREAVLAKAEREGRQSTRHRERGLLGRTFIGAEAAGYLIYHAVLAAWFVVAVAGLVKGCIPATRTEALTGGSDLGDHQSAVSRNRGSCNSSILTFAAPPRTFQRVSRAETADNAYALMNTIDRCAFASPRVEHSVPEP
jgi:hypothetical protein